MQFIKTPVKGMSDMLPADMRLREHVLSMVKSTYASFGFMQVETPMMEHIENLTSKQGGDNEKLIFKVLKRGRDLERALASDPEVLAEALADNGMRYDLTVPLARYYANNKDKLPSPFKALQIGNVWRADNPQKGRFRQFTQCDIDILGDKTNLAEIELITATATMLSQIFSEIGVSEFTIHINDREILRAAALAAGFVEDDIDAVLISLDKFDKIGFDGIRAELVGNGYDPTVVDSYLALYEQAAQGVDCASFSANLGSDALDERVVTNITEIIECTRDMVPAGASIVYDPTLVRGMGYYTGPIFEITLDGYNSSVAGGGRYDKMIGKFCGEDVCACGFSIGFERIIAVLKDHLPEGFGLTQEATAFLVSDKASLESKMRTFEQARALRETGAIATVLPMKKNMKNQIKLLEAEGYTTFEKIYE